MPVYAAPPHSYASPLRRWLRLRGYTVAAAPPPEALAMVERGEAAAGLAPLGLLLEERRARLCRNAPMVWSLGETMSVVVVSRKPAGLGGCPRIAVSGESRTSILYLALVLEEAGCDAEIQQLPWRDAARLLHSAPCALLLGDEALEARARGLHVVLDLGEAVARLTGHSPVYAATVAAPGERCPRGPPWPRATPRDAEETAARTGLPRGEAWRYHSLVRLDYSEAALLNAISLLRRGQAALERLAGGDAGCCWQPP